jgi:hypothetical protein
MKNRNVTCDYKNCSKTHGHKKHYISVACKGALLGIVDVTSVNKILLVCFKSIHLRI